MDRVDVAAVWFKACLQLGIRGHSNLWS